MKVNLNMDYIANIFIFAITFFVLLSSFAAEYILYMIPCVFCLYQRYLYLILWSSTIVQLILYKFFHNKFKKFIYIQILIIIILIITAFYHSLMQRGIIDPTFSCILQMRQLNITNYKETLCETGPQVLGLYTAELSLIMSILFLILIYISYRIERIINNK